MEALCPLPLFDRMGAWTLTSVQSACGIGWQGWPAGAAGFSDGDYRSGDRSAQHEVLLEAAKMVLTDQQPMEIARQLRERAEGTVRPTK